jgi:hypothetical protein
LVVVCDKTKKQLDIIIFTYLTDSISLEEDEEKEGAATLKGRKFRHCRKYH